MGMTRLVLIAAVAVSLSAAGIANAAPPPPAPPCAFTLSAPVIEGDQVSATVQSDWCAAAAAPFLMVACLQPGDGAAQQCSQSRGADPARVTVAYSPGVTYIANGRGCAGWIGLSPAANCQLLGPNQ